jgi:creatinine amidohydrolase
MDFMPPTRLLAELSAPDAVAALTERSVIVLPIGAIEQHGPHLPLATDLLIAEATCQAVVADRGEELDLWLLPSLGYTKSNEHAWAPGTVWLSATTLLAVLDDIGRSIAMLPSKRLVFVNGHGGNTALLNVANRELRLKYGLMTFMTHPGTPADHGGTSPAEELGMGIHGGIDETSVMAYLRPDLVDMTRTARHVPEQLAQNRYVRFGGQVSFGWLSSDFGASGVIGDPTGASVERGKELFDASVQMLGEAFAEIATFSLPLDC